MTAALLAALRYDSLRAGICTTVGLALAGVASGRIVSWVMDRDIARAPLTFLVIEAIGTTSLLCAVRPS